MSAAAQRRLTIAALIAILLAGIIVRLPADLFAPEGSLHSLGALHPQPGFREIGFDDALYRGYVNSVITGGLSSYREIVEHYIGLQKSLSGSVLPPTNVLFICAAWVWHQLFRTEALLALHDVASLFAIFGLFLSVGFAWRMKGAGGALRIGALIAFAPTQVHLSQHALVDGFFTFWAMLALWLLWENLRTPHAWRWLVPFAISLSLIVATMDDAPVVYVALVALILANRWLKWGTVTRELVLCTVLGPLLGVALLALASGGFGPLLTMKQLAVSHHHRPTVWHRYLVDLLLVSPIVVLLAIGAALHLNRERKPELFAGIFISASYLAMCTVSLGATVNYAAIWDMPLRVLAFSQLTALVRPNLSQQRTWIMAGAIALICALEMHQYDALFVHAPLNEPATDGLLRALKMLKTAPTP